MAKSNKKPDTEHKEELVEVSRREQRLRERLLTIDEDMIHDERRVHENGERRREHLTRRINKVRSRQEAKLDRLENSRLYKKSKILYVILSPFFAIGRGIRSIWRKIRGRVDHHKKVTPHRSFYLTTHAQAVRQINISGYLRFVHEVGRLIWDNKWLYFKALILLSLALLIVIGLGKQANYNDVREALEAVDLNWFVQTTGLVTQAVITSLTVTDSNKQMLATLIFIVAWLVLICLVRHIYGGRTKIKLRDALYNGTGSIVQMFILLFILLVQTLPLAIAMISYSAITGAGYINTGIKIENMAAWCAIVIIGILTVYWMITTLLCAVTITIPGIYPFRAFFETSVLVSGRRVKILFRVLMMLVPLALLWLVVLVPVVILDNALKLQYVPLVQAVTTLLVAASMIWISVYLYMLYRRLLDSPEQPIGTSNNQIIWPWQRKKRKAELKRRASQARSENKASEEEMAELENNPVTKKMTKKSGGPDESKSDK